MASVTRSDFDSRRGVVKQYRPCNKAARKRERQPMKNLFRADNTPNSLLDALGRVQNMYMVFRLRFDYMHDRASTQAHVRVPI